MNITDRNTSGFRNDHAFPTADFPIIPPFSSVFLRKRAVFNISVRRNKVFSGSALYVQTVHIFIKNAFVLCQAFSDRFCYNGKRVLYTQRAKRERWKGRKKRTERRKRKAEKREKGRTGKETKKRKKGERTKWERGKKQGEQEKTEEGKKVTKKAVSSL